jgi:hypothetical protein
MKASLMVAQVRYITLQVILPFSLSLGVQARFPAPVLSALQTRAATGHPLCAQCLKHLGYKAFMAASSLAGPRPT